MQTKLQHSQPNFIGLDTRLDKFWHSKDIIYNFAA